MVRFPSTGATPVVGKDCVTTAGDNSFLPAEQVEKHFAFGPSLEAGARIHPKSLLLGLAGHANVTGFFFRKGG
jgi:hypothetical protein